MNRDEARALLLRRMQPLFGLPYTDLHDRVDVEDVATTAGSSGVEYFLEVFVEAVDEADPEIEVSGYASEVSERPLLSPSVALSFCVAPDDSRRRRGDWSDPAA